MRKPKGMLRKIEAKLEDFGHFVYQRHWQTLLFALCLIIGFAMQIPNLQFATSAESFFHPDDPALIKYKAFKEQFGNDRVLIIAIEPPETFSHSFLLTLKDLHESLEQEVPHLDEVTSLINVTFMRGEDDEFIAEELLEHWPKDDLELESLRKQVISHPIYQNMVISEDGKYTALIVRANAHSTSGSEKSLLKARHTNDALNVGDFKLMEDIDGFELDESELEERGVIQTLNNERYKSLSDKEVIEFVEGVLGVVERFENPDLPIQLAGSLISDYTLKGTLKSDFPLFTGVCILIILIFLYVLFRRLSGVMLPLLVVISSLLSTFGLMALMGKPVTMVSQILPSFILAVCVGDSVHLLTIFYRRYQQSGDKEDAVAYAMGYTGLAMLLTSLTTAGGLLSFASANMAPVAAFGIIAACGVMIALVYTFLLIPSLLAILPIGLVEKRQSLLEHNLDRTLIAMGDFSTKRPFIVIGVSALLGALALVAASQLKFSNYPLHWFSEDHEFRQSVESIDYHLKGSMILEATVDTGIENGLYEPEFMNSLEEIHRYADDFRDGPVYIGKTSSITDTLKEIHQALNENRPEYRVIPQDKALIAQELLLLENSGVDDLEKLVDSQFSTAKVTFKLPWVDGIAYTKLLDKLDKKFVETFGNKVQINITGTTALMNSTIQNLIQSLVSSYLIAGVVITLMMILFMGNLKIGLISMIPNFLPVLLALGAMSLAGMPLDMSTILVGSIAVGLAVDDTIHFMHTFQRYYKESGDVPDAVRQSLIHSGRAMLFTTIVLSSGFFVFVLSTMVNLVNFGLIVGFTIMVAFFADVLLAPALMALVYRKD